MSAAWDAHYKRISDLIAGNPVQRAPAAAATPVTVQPGVQAMLPAGLLDMWQGGGNGGQMGAPGGVDYGGAPGDMSALGGKFGGFGGLAGGLLGGLAGTALAGPFGGALGAWGGRALAGLLGGPAQTGVAQPTEPGSIGGDFGPGGSGPNAFGGGLGSLGAAGMGLGLGGLGAMSGNEIMGFGGMGGFGGVDGGSGDMSQGDQSGAGPNSGDMGMGMGQFQQGGYTGAGADGVVQPWRRAGVVHEGEMVIPHRVVRGLLAR